MPSGRVRWFDAKKGFGFITNDEGEDVFLPAAALPDGVTTLRKGARVEFSVIDGRKGPQAMGVTLVASVPSLVKATRPKPDDDDMAAMVEGGSSCWIPRATSCVAIGIPPPPTAGSSPHCCVAWLTASTCRNEGTGIVHA